MLKLSNLSLCSSIWLRNTPGLLPVSQDCACILDMPNNDESPYRMEILDLFFPFLVPQQPSSDFQQIWTANCASGKTVRLILLPASTVQLWKLSVALDQLSESLSLHQQHPVFLRRCKNFGTNTATFVKVCWCTTETECIAVWSGNLSTHDQRTVRMASKTSITGITQLQRLYWTRCKTRAQAIIMDSSHPVNILLSPLPSSKHLQSITSTGTAPFRKL